VTPNLLAVDRAGFHIPIHCLGDGPDFVFLHGLGSDATDIVEEMGPVAGFRLVLPDQRGHGEASPGVDKRAFQLEDLVLDLDAVLDHREVSAAVVGGGSMGAAVALRHALTRPRRYRALVLVAPAIGAERAQAAAYIVDVANRIDAIGLEKAVVELRAAAVAQGMLESEAQALGHAWLRQDASSLTHAMRAVDSWRPFSSLTELNELELPVALVAVRDDHLHPVPLAEQISAALPLSSLEVLPRQDALVPGAIGAAVARRLAYLGVRERIDAHSDSETSTRPPSSRSDEGA
jgi:pimeloyl-ACP methyl ester carboxylesterase